MYLKRAKERRAFDNRRDEILHYLLDNPISYENWDSSKFSDYDTEERFLASEKYLQETNYGYQITPKGVAHIKDGGFSGERRRRNAVIAFAAFSAVLAGISISVQFILK